MAFTADQLAAIKEFTMANRGNPELLIPAMEQFGVDVGTLSQATGIPVQDWNNYFTNAGVRDGWQGVTTVKSAYAKPFAGQDPNASYLNVMGQPVAMSRDPLHDPNAAGVPNPAADAAAATAPGVVVGGSAPGTTAAQNLNPIRQATPAPTGGMAAGPAQTAPVGGGVVQPGTGYGGGGYPTPYPVSAGPAAPVPSQFNTPVLDALYNAQQQRMTSPAPSFNFQQHLKRGGPVVGALTRVIRGK